MVINRDSSIDILKFFAVFLITSSHFEDYYHPYEFLSTGGAIGDALFFFCSGYTLLLKDISKADFFNWYKRRINRIYPTVLAWAIIACLFFSYKGDITDTILHTGGVFVQCIMVYYVIFFMLRNIIVKYPATVLAVSVMVSLAVFLLDGENSLWGWRLPCKVNFFSFMLVGAIVGQNRDRWGAMGKTDALWLSLFVALYYGVLFVTGRTGCRPLMFLSVVPLALLVIWGWKICHAGIFRRMYDSRVWNTVIMALGGICLEVYICQAPLLHGWLPDTLYPLFPLNIPIGFVAIFSLAFATHICANLIAQTFKEKDYDWRKMVLYWK